MFCSCNVQLAHKKNHKKVLISLETNKLRIKIKNVFSKQTFLWHKKRSKSVKRSTVQQINNNLV